MNRLKSCILVFVCLMAGNFVYIGQVSAQSFLNKLKNAAEKEVSNNTSGTSVTNVLSSVIGSSSTIAEKDLVGTWKYNGSDCAFQSEDLLAKAGGEVAAGNIESKLNTAFSKVNVKASNTMFTFNNDKTFSGKLMGKDISGTYTLDSKNSKINFKGALFTSTCYVSKTGSNLSLLFDSSKLLSVLQTVGKFSSNSYLTTISSLSKNYKGVKLGFQMKK
mgnify:CR=1 FL=1